MLYAGGAGTMLVRDDKSFPASAVARFWLKGEREPSHQTTLMKLSTPHEPGTRAETKHSLTTPVAGGDDASEPGKRIRVLIAEDHPIVRRGIKAMLANHPRIEVSGEASDGQEALAKAKELKPDVLLVDIEMPLMNGFVVTDILRQELPRTRALFLSAHSGLECVPRILQSGARGYLTKGASAGELVQAIESVAAGGTHFGPEVAQLVLARLVESRGEPIGQPGLSAREKEILSLIAEGLYNKEIAARLNIGTRTVETHRERLMRKLKIHSAAGLTAYAVANGFVVLPKAAESCTQ